MTDSQEQSIDEDVTFLPISQSSPDYHHCEGERYALESLLSSGPEAFYTRLRDECLVPFLSQEEVNLITGWVQGYQISQVQLEEESEHGCSFGVQDTSSSYFPNQSDTPVPWLDLGWPEKVDWMGMGTVKIYTSPHVPGQPPVREIIRRLLQGATKLIAMVTDRLTDDAVIGDLHTMALQGVAVYIILNRRSIHDTMKHHRLRHPNIRVRVLGGKNFFSREGKMVIGEMKSNFLLVDLETVVNGSYSFTWSDAHLHRQLVTVLTGPAVECFDREFRIIFAASLPAPDTWKNDMATMNVSLHNSKFLDVNKQPSYLSEEAINHPHSDLPMVQVAQGVGSSPVNQYKKPSDMNVNRTESPVNNKSPFHEEFCPEENKDSVTTLLDEERVLYKTHVRHLSEVNMRHSENEMQTSPTEEAEASSSIQKRDSPARREDVTVDYQSDEDNSGVNSTVKRRSTFRRHLKLNMPQSESILSLSDIMRRLRPNQTNLRWGSKNTISDLSRSMMDLRMMHTDPSFQNKRPSVPEASFFEPLRMTPALALMRNRSDDLKTENSPKTFLTTTRPRSSSFVFDRNWKRSQTDLGHRREERK
ncbi:hypothetical protein DPEC_G00205630 [Dallia pectoralis]|uniref:Uncharacterized protein n=1 Tax=Dallia pectoralis TaxID=75939 RepID=A0ACC2G4M7_DALPE|nr:hypothetical protein DPEC_G00205630 [Dallia pectoralis]